jgi:hypothetical protein
MALRPTCDVYGTAYDVKTYSIRVVEVDRETGDLIDGSTPFTASCDLCSRAYERLKRNIAYGISKPRKRKEKS